MSQFPYLYVLLMTTILKGMSDMTEEEYQIEIVRLRSKLVYVAKCCLGSAEGNAEDIVQNVLLKLWQNREEVSIPIDALASVMVRNASVDFLRQQKRKREKSMIIDSNEDIGVSYELVERMMSIVETLPIMQKTVIKMRHIEGLEITAIADALGCTDAAIRKTLSRARQAVRDKFMKDKK